MFMYTIDKCINHMACVLFVVIALMCSELLYKLYVCESVVCYDIANWY